jgi:hypothetical protein
MAKGTGSEPGKGVSAGATVKNNPPAIIKNIGPYNPAAPPGSGK